MDVHKLEALLAEVQNGQVSIEQAMQRLRGLPYEDLGFATLDLHRALRTGLPEVVYCAGKTVEQVRLTFEHLWQHHARVMGTRVSSEMAAALVEHFPQAKYDPTSRLLTLSRTALTPPAPDAPYILVVCAGTSDVPVAEEAAQTLEFLNVPTQRAYDVGVAGLHRLLDRKELLFNAAVIISIAGMDGALTSVVGGLASCPVIGVPTSVGYGASFNGLAALLTMLNSCATGVAVVNIDNGFGAAMFAHSIYRKITQG